MLRHQKKGGKQGCFYRQQKKNKKDQNNIASFNLAANLARTSANAVNYFV